MTKKQKTVAMRFVRTLAATIIGFLAAWATGPDAASIINDPTARMVLVSIIAPSLVAANKHLRYGSDDDDE